MRTKRKFIYYGIFTAYDVPLKKFSEKQRYVRMILMSSVRVQAV